MDVHDQLGQKVAPDGWRYWFDRDIGRWVGMDPVGAVWDLDVLVVNRFVAKLWKRLRTYQV